MPLSRSSLTTFASCLIVTSFALVFRSVRSSRESESSSARRTEREMAYRALPYSSIGDFCSMNVISAGMRYCVILENKLLMHFSILPQTANIKTLTPPHHPPPLPASPRTWAADCFGGAAVPFPPVCLPRKSGSSTPAFWVISCSGKVSGRGRRRSRRCCLCRRPHPCRCPGR